MFPLERRTEPIRTTCATAYCAHAGNFSLAAPRREVKVQSFKREPRVTAHQLIAPCRPCGYQSGSSFQTTVAGSLTALQKAQAELRSDAVR